MINNKAATTYHFVVAIVFINMKLNKLSIDPSTFLTSDLTHGVRGLSLSQL